MNTDELIEYYVERCREGRCAIASITDKALRQAVFEECCKDDKQVGGVEWVFKTLNAGCCRIDTDS